MELQLQRPLLFFDIESTGLNIAADAIIELSFVKVFPDAEKQIKTWKIRPWDYQRRVQIPITPGASEVNGVKDEDLVDCPRFIEVAPEIASWLRDSDLAGFNSAKFDLPMLAEEFERAAQYCRSRIDDPKTDPDRKAKAQETLALIDIDLHGARMVDVQNIYHYMEPRNLRAAYRFYCGGNDFENAHTAEADTLATYEVLKGQLDMYSTADSYHDQPLKNDVEYLSGIGGRSKGVDFAARIIMRDGVPVINFGKYKDRPVREVYEKDRGYFRWIEEGEFTLDTKSQFRRLAREFDEEKKNRPVTEDDLAALKQKFGSA